MWLAGCHGSMGTCVKLGPCHRLVGGLGIAFVVRLLGLGLQDFYFLPELGLEWV